MLHREPDAWGTVDWRQISGLEQHGEYDAEISEDEAMAIARETKEYEDAFLNQEIAFLEYMKEYFTENHLKHVQKVYDDRMRAFSRGYPIRIMVFCDGGLAEHTIRMEGAKN
jgi:hypothetical protein